MLQRQPDSASSSHQDGHPTVFQRARSRSYKGIITTKNNCGGDCRFFLMLGIAATVLAPLLLYHHGSSHVYERRNRFLMNVLDQPEATSNRRRPFQRISNTKQGAEQQDGLPSPVFAKIATPNNSNLNNNNNGSSKKANSRASWNHLLEQAEQAEQSILDFFHGETRALKDGVPFGGTSVSILANRLASRMAQCDDRRRRNSNSNSSVVMEECVLRCVFVGSGQMAGRDSFYNQSYPFQTRERLRALANAAGLTLEVLNQAIDSDLSREGPQTAHMCTKNVISDNSTVDVVVWDFETTMQGRPQAQVEAFVRWILAGLKPAPAMILFNRPGPHTRSRRGTKHAVVNLVGDHDAILWEDNNPEDMPEMRQEPYRNSSKYKELWENNRNYFWEPIMQRYAPFADFAAIDPQGSIWHLDHLQDFSNAAFDEGKALPLFDCPSPPHPPPCDQVPPVIHRHLARANMSIDTLPRHDTAGALCGVMWGCRHSWYGGPRSHALRAALNALPIVRALRQAASLLQSREREDQDTIKLNKTSNMQHSIALSMATLPDPAYCSKIFCGRVPSCLTSYLPSLSGELSKAIVSNKTSPHPMPRLGACHYAHNPSFAIKNLDTRFKPLGYVDRKYALRLAADNGKPRGAKDNDQGFDASTTSIAFNMTGPGPVVLCEPPCFITSECSPKRKMPLVNHISMELDGVSLKSPKDAPAQTEVGGKFCRVIAKSVDAGEHILRITTTAVYPDHVMFSQLVSFS